MSIFSKKNISYKKISKTARKGVKPFGRFFVIFLSLLSFFAVSFWDTASVMTYAQTVEEEENIQNTPQEDSKQQQIEQLRQDLEELERKLDQNRAKEAEYRAESRGYSRDISILENQIYGIRLEMQKIQIILQQTDLAIETNKEIIAELDAKIERQKQLMSDLLLSIYKLDSTSAVEIVLTKDTLSEFFDDVNRIKNLQTGLSETLQKVKEIKKDLEIEKAALEEKLEEQASTLQLQNAQNAQLAIKIDEKEELLAASRSKQEEYGEIVNSTAKTITEIRNQLFRLEGAGVAVTFEEAYNHAKHAENITGVRAAFLLSVLKQESSWGKNVGLCTLHNKDNGDGKGVNTGRIIPRVMKVSRDIEPFFQITQELGRDPYNTRVSCWPEIYWDGVPYGYGGAMGPAQFLPSTWMGYRDRVSALLGRSADPWLISDAFLASAVKLAAAGAAKGSYDAEWCAAMIYYSGRCPGPSINHFYGNQIMNRASDYQRDIDVLEGR